MNAALPYLMSLCLLNAPPDDATPQTQPATPRDTLESIEAFRGGRHWADAETAPPRSPAESLKSFQIEPGVKLELFAAEPLVQDPVAITFDQRGRMFIVEYGDYPIGPAEGGKPLSRVVMLEDSDGDGTADRRHVFADGLNFAHSLMAYRDGLIVGAQTQILFLKDTDGDHRADVREVLFEGFVAAHPQMQIGNPRWGFDNWIYFNYGPGKITSPNAPGKVVEMPRQEFRFHPLSGEFERASGLGQFGNTIDNFGRRFFCTNRNPIMTTMFSQAVMNRNPFGVMTKSQYDVGPSGGDTRVYPIVEMKSNYLSHAGTHTSACGVTAYRGDLLGEQFQDSVFVCEPIGHLVTRSIIRADGAALTSERARPKADFIASSDTWFRPASLATGPDGALYLADMYRLWVEHPKFLPEDVAKKLDWRAGDDRGRIYRIVPENSRPSLAEKRFASPASDVDCVALLSDANGWRRQLGQRLLVERQAVQVAPQLRDLLKNGSSGRARQHSLWTLDGLGKLTVGDVAASLNDDDLHVRSDAVKLAAMMLGRSSELLDGLAELVDDDVIQVRLQVAVALGETSSERGTELLTRIALRDGSDDWMTSAILTSSRERSGAILAGVLADKSFADAGGTGQIQLVKALATVVGARGDLDEVTQALRVISATDDAGAWWQAATLSGLATGLPRNRGSVGVKSLAALVATPPEQLGQEIVEVRRLLNAAQDVALDQSLKVNDRLAAIELLSFQSFDAAAAAYSKLLATDQPVALQLASIDAMNRNGAEQGADLILERWSSLGPTLRGPALEFLMRRTTSTIAALEAMESGSIPASAVDVDHRVRLLKSTNEKIQNLAIKVFGGAVSANRREVAERYRAALSLKSSAAAGVKVFERICIKCHKLDGRGHDVGPDISDVRNRSHEALLFDILDPNSKVEPRFTDYSVELLDGRTFNGLMISESAEAVVLRQAEGKERVIARSEIDSLRASGRSLMPEGVEKDISVQEMADLIAFLKSRQ
jgi:putative membrane-bound dehydrogenase-like protein